MSLTNPWTLLIIATMTACSMVSATKDPLRLDDPYDFSIKDLLDKSVAAEARFFNLDRGAAFNTSIGFTIPIISFTLPGGMGTSVLANPTGPNQSHYVNNQVGMLGFLSLFMVGAVATGIYTTLQNGRVPSPFRRAPELEEARFLSSHSLNFIYDLMEEFPEAINFENCVKQSICEAHGNTEKYGFLSWPIRLFVLAYNGTSSAGGQTEFQKAAAVGKNNGEDCRYKYQCIVQPLNALLEAKDLVKNYYR